MTLFNLIEGDFVKNFWILKDNKGLVYYILLYRRDDWRLQVNDALFEVDSPVDVGALCKPLDYITAVFQIDLDTDVMDVVLRRLSLAMPVRDMR